MTRPTAMAQRLDHHHGDYATYLQTASGVPAMAAAKAARDGLLNLRPGTSALEVGCGLGDDARRLADLVGADGEVVGVDVSTAMIEQAQRADDRVRWTPADAHELPFPAGRFDAARAERVLQHTRDPQRVVDEMVRTVRPGGVVLACEPDWATLALSGEDQHVVDALRAAAESVISHPRVGRELPALLQRAGVRDVRVAAECVVIRDFALLEVLGDLAALMEVLVTDGHLTRAVAERFTSRLREDASAGRMTGLMTIVTAWGPVA